MEIKTELWLIVRTYEETTHDGKMKSVMLFSGLKKKKATKRSIVSVGTIGSDALGRIAIYSINKYLNVISIPSRKKGQV